LQVPAFVTYWGHDVSGYHPCIMLCLEGDGKTQMAGMPVQMQAQFRVVAEGLLTVGRETAYFTDHAQLMTAPMRGKRAFELELNPSDWPVIECKVLAKVNDATDDEVQNLFPDPVRVKPEAMSDEDATTQLSFRLGSIPRSKRPRPSGSETSQTLASTQSYSAPSKPPPDEKPLMAIAATLGTPIPKPQTRLQEGFEQYLQKTILPGLGDDFYAFEKVLGLPTDTDNRDRNWVWAGYRKHPQVKIFVGSKGSNGKADVIVAAIDCDSPLTDTQFANVSRALSSKFRNEKMAPAEHSVRYTQGGRVELTNIAAQSYRAVYFTTRDADQNKLAIVSVSRQPGSLSELLKEEGQKTTILHLLLKGLGADGSNQ
jgi:hypothetical protein